MKYKVRWLVPAIILVASFLFADEIYYDDGTPYWGYRNGG